MSSIMRRRSGEIFSGESFMALLRLRNEADCLTSQHTKQNPGPQLPVNRKTKSHLTRERFSPSTPTCRWSPSALRPLEIANRLIGSSTQYSGIYFPIDLVVN